MASASNQGIDQYLRYAADARYGGRLLYLKRLVMSIAIMLLDLCSTWPSCNAKAKIVHHISGLGNRKRDCSRLMAGHVRQAPRPPHQRA